MGNGVIKTLSDCCTFERQTPYPSRPKEILDPACRVELAYSHCKGVLFGAAERRLRSVWPPHTLVADRLIEQPGETLLVSHLRK
jgi:hypothetical protein